MRRALVTGGTGFTGSHLVNDLLGDGWDVRVLARSLERARRTLPASVEIVQGDVTDREAVWKAVRGSEVVYHVAAAFREAGIPDERYRAVHVDGTRHLLEASRAEGVSRFVHTSTIGVHGHIEHPPGDEDAPYNAGDIYQSTKLDGELFARRFGEEHDFPVSVIRPATIYGPGDLRLLKMFRMIARRRFFFLGSGQTSLHMVHVADLVRGLRLAAEHPAAVGDVFIIAGEESRSLNEIGAMIADAVGAPPPWLHLPVWPFYAAGAVMEAVCVPLGIEPPIYRRRVSFFTKHRAFRIDRARNKLGYNPTMDLQAGLRDTVSWYRAHGHLS